MATSARASTLPLPLHRDVLCSAGRLLAESHVATSAAGADTGLPRMILPRALDEGTLSGFASDFVSFAQIVARSWATRSRMLAADALARPKAVVHGLALTGHDDIVVSGSQTVALEPAQDAPRPVCLRIEDLACLARVLAAGDPDPIEALAAVVAGYATVAPLTDLELEVAFDAVLASLLTAVIADPAATSSAAYLLSSLSSLSRDWVHFRLRAAMGLPDPVPGTAQLVAALGDPARTLPSLFADPAVARRAAAQDSFLVLDLSANSPHVTATDVADPAMFTAAVDAALAAAGAEFGLGQYLEDRSIYGTDAYAPLPAPAAPGDAPRRADGPQSLPRRSMHLGVDVFAPAGTEVCALLPGQVHSFAVNAAFQDYGPTVVLAHSVAALNVAAGGGAAAGIDTFYTLYGHLSIDSLAGLQVGMHVPAGAVVGALGDVEVNGGWPPHLHFQIMLHMCGKNGDFEGVAQLRHAPLYASLTPDPNLLLRFPALGETHRERDTASREVEDALIARRTAVLSPNLSLSFDEPLHIVRGEGQYLYAADGTQYLDCVNNVCHVGHCHPRVVAAAAAQIAVLNTNTRYLHTNVLDYAEKLLATFPDELCVAFFVNSGSEANDLALRLARAASGGDACIVLDGAYHGHLSSLIELSPYKFNGRGGSGQSDHVHVVPMPDPYRHPEACDGGAAGAAALASIAAAGQKVTALFAESVLGCGGQVVLPDGYLADLYAAVRAAGGVTVADEVQVGFGRVGSFMWAFESQGVVPDIVTLGKPMGNGHPLAGVVTTRAIADAFHNGMEFFSTFGGNPVSMAVGAAVLDAIDADGLMANAAARGAQLLAGFRALQARHPLIGDVRGMGLFIGVELVRDAATKEPAVPEIDAVVEHIRRHWRTFVSTDGPLHNVLKLKPPLCLSHADCERVIAALDDALTRVEAGDVASSSQPLT
ncbi:4-aminobutyrate transaminase [Thecamonas trahens ATCC 50062]|uniref:4-aminobutyrate transaminase n=1 Tax=Thecamonas trahens ATCC 50062 TaxID=461836 RepID=A0A0L0D706_THETB|nr:4-aminobutyrate transaminase [Thecamonas trahens ATCC 50062]KNC48157.1 4-aminobutyrate transaminase [Thecamonas trahens ATCC 50062]|eukprot:XP_013758727.1 4-aminobutyrate transaminase [Thecamonas trahens ATCC 50062]